MSRHRKRNLTLYIASYFIAAVSKEFDEVYILSDINERSGFFRSLGPEFNELQEAVGYYRDKVMGTV